MKAVLWISLILLVLGIGSCTGFNYYDKLDKHETIYNVNLVDSYATTQHCGHKGRYDCEIFKGRFVITSEGPRKGWTTDQEIDGFMHYAFQKNGAQPFPTQLALTDEYMKLSDHQGLSFILFAIGWFSIAFALFIPFMYFVFEGDV